MTDISFDTAMADCRMRVKASGSSFTAGMIVLPPKRRDAMFALYAFCREVDDIADDAPSLAEKRAGLEKWRGWIKTLYATGKCSDTITTALAPAIGAYALPEEDFQAIIDGMAMDAEGPICAPDYQTLDIYCDRVASAVGRLSVRIFGDTSDHAMQLAFHLGRALQLTNILRDLAEDAARGRLYLPEELLVKHHVMSRVPREALNAACLIPVCRDLAEKAQEHFNASYLALRFCDPKTMRPARIMGAYYQAILKRLVAEDWQIITRRVSLPKWQKIWLLIKVLIG